MDRPGGGTGALGRLRRERKWLGKANKINKDGPKLQTIIKGMQAAGTKPRRSLAMEKKTRLHVLFITWERAGKATRRLLVSILLISGRS